MKASKRFWAALAVLGFALALTGCSDGSGLDDNGGIGSVGGVDSDARDGGFETGGRGDAGEVTVGGFSVQGPGDEEISIPEAEADRNDVESYVESVRPVADDGVRDLSTLVDSGAGLEGETANLGLGAESVEDALEANQDAVETLQNIAVPADLGDINDALVDSRERAVSAYDNINQTFVNDASSDEVADAIEESLPEVEYADAETRAILQELERASSSS